MSRWSLVAVLAGALAAAARAEPPHASYIFPAGGQRGTTVKFKVGGHFLHERCPFELLGPGIAGPSELARSETTWFEGPLIRQPASQQAEDYPQDYAGEVAIAADASLGRRWWRCWNAQGVTAPLPFVVGDLPEIVEEETDGQPLPVPVTLPVTINGRVFPREDADVWTFDAAAGQSVTCAVTARDLGSPLVARLEVRDPAGKMLAESTGDAMAEARLRFAAPAAGRYAVRISDVAAGGMQHYVYRLTITSGPWIDHMYPLGGRRGSKVKLETIGQAIAGSSIEWNVPEVEAEVIEQAFETAGGRTNFVCVAVSDVPEQLESEPNEATEQTPAVAAPCVLNGRIQRPGDVDLWRIELPGNKPVRLDVQSVRLGSPLLPVLAIRDPGGKQLAELDGASGKDAATLAFTPPADGSYVLEVRERFDKRGGPQFAYRIHVAEPHTDFQLFAPDSLAIDVGTEKKLEIAVERRGDWKTPLAIRVEGLPAGVTCDHVEVPANANKASLTFKCPAGVPVTSANLRIIGRGKAGEKTIEREAIWIGNKDGFGRGEPVPCCLATTLPTPFKFTAQYSFIYAPRGGVLRKRYTIDRGGLAGPLVAQLADRQGRHLQGVTGPVVAIPAEASEFEYPLHLPSWMELGRTSRTNLMLTGELKDAAGVGHKVCWTTRDQNEQLIALVTAAALRLSLDRPNYAVQPGQELSIPLAVKRDASVTSPVKIELTVPRHMRDIAAEPVVVAAHEQQATLVLRLGNQPGPLNMPLTIRATCERGGDPITAETPLELVKDTLRVP